IIKVGLDILWKSLREFTDTAPRPEIMQQLNQLSRAVEGVMDVHDLRVRISGGFYQAEIHIVVDGQLTVVEGHRIAKTVERCLEQEMDALERVIVHVDPAEEG
ncbi:MAG: cation transporter dimerization domain-containing protein, partial [Desulfobacterales bacterium]